MTDPATLRFRLATLKTGAWLGLAMIAAGLAYLGLSWDDGNRPLLCAIAVGLAVCDVAVLLAARPMARIVSGRWREAFFLSWTLSNVAALLLLAALDPTSPSPLTLPLLMPMLFAGMSYPRWSATASCAAVVFGYGIEALILGQDLAYSGFFFMCLFWTAGMCLWQAGNRERQRAELESQRDALARVSRADPLTDALNRRGFEERLQLELADARRAERPLTLAVLDLDDFKGVNDREGHAAGDELLRVTVRRMHDVVRPMDAVGRVGGDEFAMLLVGAGADEADTVIGRLSAALAGEVAASIGHSSFPADGVTADALLAEADRRLYEAKGLRGRAPNRDETDLGWAAALADAVNLRTPGARRSPRAVADHAVAIGAHQGWSEPQLALLRLAATLHHVDGLEEIVAWVRHAREHADGSGVADEHEIPAASRILLAADAFDALTSDPPVGAG